jgi:beta-galactosidase/beta-glucuronidase
MNKVLELKNGWFLEYDGKLWPAKVPGDVTLDLFDNKLIKDPYFGLNHRDLHWIRESDFTYKNEFSLSDDVFAEEEILLEFDGIDTFAEIYQVGRGKQPYPISLRLQRCSNKMRSRSLAISTRHMYRT